MISIAVLGMRRDEDVRFTGKLPLLQYLPRFLPEPANERLEFEEVETTWCTCGREEGMQSNGDSGPFLSL